MARVGKAHWVSETYMRETSMVEAFYEHLFYYQWLSIL